MSQDSLVKNFCYLHKFHCHLYGTKMVFTVDINIVILKTQYFHWIGILTSGNSIVSLF